jgi:hypothetical protein
MANVFFSWSFADKAGAMRLRDRLRDLGLEVWEYSDQGLPGAQIRDEILSKINQATTAVICFSDATAHSPWITDEVAWCWQNQKNRSLRQIIPVWVGPHPHGETPRLLREENIRVSDLDPATEESIAAFGDLVFKALDREAPERIPAALFAMTRRQCQDLLNNLPQNWVVQELCGQAGMEPPPGLFTALLNRYGDTPEDFAPYETGIPLVQTIQNEVGSANHWRMRNGKSRRPIALSWIQGQFSDPGRKWAARSLWTSRDSILVIDSISMFHPAVQAAVSNVPDLNRTAVLWIPPYTQQAASVEKCLKEAARIVDRVGDLFEAWNQDPLRPITFDPQTRYALRQWLRRTLAEIALVESPNQDALSSMYGIRDAQVDPGRFFRGQPRD